MMFGRLSLLSGGGGLPAPPSGYAYLVDDSGNFLIDDSGNYLIGAVT